MLELKQAKVGIIFETQCNYMTCSIWQCIFTVVICKSQSQLYNISHLSYVALISNPHYFGDRDTGTS